MRHSGFIRGSFGILIFIAVFALGGLAVMYLWNLLIPSVIGWAAINYWQALGFMVLSRLLFGGMGKLGHFRHFGHPGPFGPFSREEHDHIHEQMRNMSWEERREYIRQHMADFRNGRNRVQETDTDNRQQ
ncbi:MAG: hypothetical protein LUD46_22100 [Parabacteroides sp.]|nr:hypothetical protein [Parabacteroides sp.]